MVQPRRDISSRVAGPSLAPVLLLATALAGCGGGSTTAQHVGARSAAAASSATANATAGPSSSTTATTTGPDPAPSSSPGGTSPGAAQPGAGAAKPASGGSQAPAAPATHAASGALTPQPGTWEIEVYYTPVESFHHGALQTINGCGPKAPDSCSQGKTPLGSYPADFLQAVQDNDDGLITSGPYTNDYLSWDDDDGWSIDTTDLQDNDQPMQPWVTAGAPDGIAAGTHFKVLSCGVNNTTGKPIAGNICQQFMAANWVVGDSTGDPAGTRDVELYIGRETGPNFESTPLVIDDIDARTTLP